MAVFVNHASHPASGPHGEGLAAGEHRKKRIGGLRLRSNHAAEALAIAAVGATSARNPVGIAIRFAGIGRRMRMGMITELFGRFFEPHSDVGCFQRRQRIFARSRSLEDIATLDLLPTNVAGLAADTHHLFAAPIVRFEIVVGDAPILHGDIFGKMRSAELFSQVSRQDELGFEETEGITVPVLARAAYARAGEKRAVLADGNGRVAHGVAMRDGLVGDVLHHPNTDGVVELVHSGRVVGGFAWGSALENQNRKGSAAGDFFGHREAGPAAANNRHVYRLESFHFRCYPGDSN